MQNGFASARTKKLRIESKQKAQTEKERSLQDQYFLIKSLPLHKKLNMGQTQVIVTVESKEYVPTVDEVDWKCGFCGVLACVVAKYNPDNAFIFDQCTESCDLYACHWCRSGYDKGRGKMITHEKKCKKKKM